MFEDRAEQQRKYKDRMRRSKQFSFFGIDPLWKPGEGDVEGFVHDEVVRQYHDTREYEDGGKRVDGMMEAWRYAQSKEQLTPTLDDVLTLGKLVEPEMNMDGFRTVWVSVGGQPKIGPTYVPAMMDVLMAVAGNVVPGESRGTVDGPLVEVLFVEGFRMQVKDLIKTVDDWYLGYEWIHPFGDGNGRTGKILHNWLGGTLHEPVLVRDYFGGGNP